jgi:glycosyltransferase involved in cell wall biosynthesis
MTIWVNTLVQNEDKYLWYSVASVIDYVDKILIWDTGSTDNTVTVVEELKRRWPGKIEFKEIGTVVREEYFQARQNMLQASDCDWLMILDGDEIWWEDSIKEVTKVIKTEGDKYDSIVCRYVNLIGDVFHYQERNAGKYKIKDQQGFITIRAMNKKRISGLKSDKPHGQNGFYDARGVVIQERDKKDMYFLQKDGFMHFTNLQRSNLRSEDLKVPKRAFKFKHEIGEKFPLNYYYPDVFFKNHPQIVGDVWKNMDKSFYVRSLFETPLRKIKRLVFEGKSGY